MRRLPHLRGLQELTIYVPIGRQPGKPCFVWSESAVELFVEAASGGAQVGEHGQDAAVSVFGVGDVELGEQPAYVGLDRALAEEQPSGHAGVGVALIGAVLDRPATGPAAGAQDAAPMLNWGFGLRRTN